MTNNLQTNYSQKGMTLIETGVVILIASIIIASTALLFKPYLVSSKLETTKIKQENISQSLASFAQTYGRLPCPAAPNPSAEPFGYPRNSGADGKSFATTKCGTSTQSYNGILPFQVLGLSEEQAKDSYGNFMSYAVEPAMTDYDPTATTAGDFNTVQASCATTQWADNGKLKNANKAHVCCPLRTPEDAAKGMIVISKATSGSAGTPGSTTPGSFITGPGADTSETVYENKTVNVTIVPRDAYLHGPQKESGFTSTANGDAVMIGRLHSGDENGQTSYRYAYLKAVDDQGVEVPATITVDEKRWETSHKESQAVYIARGGTVIIGRSHSGDENGQTNYYTGFIRINGQATTMSDVHSETKKESTATWYEATNKFMMLRLHQGDENGQTTNQSATIKGTVQERIKKIVYHHQDGTTTQGPETVVPPTEGTGATTAQTAALAPYRVIAYSLISHGENGDGAYIKNSNARKQITAPANAAENANYGGNLNFVDADHSTSSSNSYFDDIVSYKTNDQLMSEFNNNSCIGAQ